MSHSTTLSRLALGVAATAATSASGAIVVFDINPDITHDNFDFPGTLSISSINLQTVSYLTSGSTSPSLQVSVGYGSYALLSFSGNGVSVGTTFLPAEALISQDLGFTNPSFYTYSVPTGTTYLALRLSNGGDLHYGWFEFNSTDGQSGQNVFTFTRFAFNDVAGQSILAGQTTAVPEASTLGLVGGLFGLVAAAHVRRRKLKQAAASDKFLALAAGEKLN